MYRMRMYCDDLIADGRILGLYIKHWQIIGSCMIIQVNDLFCWK